MGRTITPKSPNESGKDFRNRLQSGTGNIIPTKGKDETDKEYRDKLVDKSSNFFKKTDKLKKGNKTETKESMGADASGSFEASLSKPIKKKGITKIHNSKPKEEDVNEVTDASSSGAFSDVPFGGKNTKGGRKNPLKIDGVKSIKNSRAVKDKNFPKWGGPGGVFVTIKDKCKKFPYCNQGDMSNIELHEVEKFKKTIAEVSKETNIPISLVYESVLNEIKKIFI